MTKICEDFYKRMKILHETSRIEIPSLGEFDDVFKDNASRMHFISCLLRLDIDGILSPKLHDFIKDNYEFLINYEKGKISEKHLSVPLSIVRSIKEEKTTIPSLKSLPSNEEICVLLDLITINNRMCTKTFSKINFRIKLPDNTIHSNIIESFKINKSNIPHLMGLTSRDSSLLEVFVKIDKKNNPDLYDEEGKPKYKEKGPASRIVEFYTSNDGKKIIIELYKKQRDFLKKHSTTKFKNIDEFKKIFYEELGFHYPLIEISNMFAKNIGLFNFMDLSHISEIIVDYFDQRSGCDVFLVDYNSTQNAEDVEYYTSIVARYFALYEIFANLTEEEKQIFLSESGNSLGINPKVDEVFLEQLRDNYSKGFLETFRISNDILIKEIEKRKKTFNDQFGYNIQLLGFAKTNDSELETSLNERVLFDRYCKTLKVCSVPLMMQEYLTKGRGYFIDQISSSNGGMFRVSNCPDEISYLEKEQLVFGKTPESTRKLDELRGRYNEMLEVQQQYVAYLGNTFDNNFTR